MGKRTVSLSSGDVDVDIIRSSRRTVALYVRPGGRLLIRAPWFVPVSILMKFAAGKAGWIEKQIARLKNVIPPGSPLTISDGCEVPFMGGQVEVKVIRGPVRRISHHGNKLILNVREDSTPEELAGMTEAWYLREAQAYLPARTRELATVHSALLPAPGTVNVRKMKRRWGTCHTGGAIWLNRELIKKDPELIDYVIIHELCHLVHHNHGKDYYALLGMIVPDFRDKRKRMQN
jgi:predicted metal-dependent hydrolase